MRIQDLQRVEPFDNLDETALEQLASEFVEMLLPAEYPVFQEGTPVDAFYVVKEGRVVVYRDAVGKPVQLLARIGPDEFFGEFALFTQADSTISARTVERSRVLKIEKQTLLDFLDDQPAIALKLQMAAAKRHTINAAAALELGKRNEVRIRINRPVLLSFRDGSTTAVTLDNLSAGGLSLRGAPDDWQIDEFVEFHIEHAGESLPCEGRVAWTRGDLVGVAFSDTSDDHSARIQKSLRRLLGTTHAR